jgi:hypothetical protein
MTDKPSVPKVNGADTPKTPEIAFVRSADFISVYANFIRINFNAFEVAILFGQAGVIPERQEAFAVDMKARVALSLIEAKLLIEMLTNTVDKFEKKYGTVSIPDDVKLPVEGKAEGA